nr:hypothetical protein CFP56_10503 [Quercus suber]
MSGLVAGIYVVQVTVATMRLQLHSVRRRTVSPRHDIDKVLTGWLLKIDTYTASRSSELDQAQKSTQVDDAAGARIARGVAIAASGGPRRALEQVYKSVLSMKIPLRDVSNVPFQKMRKHLLHSLVLELELLPELEDAAEPPITPRRPPELVEVEELDESRGARAESAGLATGAEAVRLRQARAEKTIEERMVAKTSDCWNRDGRVFALLILYLSGVFFAAWKEERGFREKQKAEVAGCAAQCIRLPSR